MSSADTTALFERRVADAVRRCGVAPADLLLVAVSGGPDSLALLHALARSRSATGLRLHAAHLDHALRGSESAADADFVVEACRKLGLGITTEKADVAAFQQAGRFSLEDAARRVRYDFLARAAAELGASAAALGHTLDDQAETVLMNVIRGSGLTGLSGMGECSRRRIAGADLLLARPLLGVSRSETEGYCAALGLSPRDDPSNRSPRFTRNRVRHDVMPALAKINPAVRDAIARLSESAARDLDYIEGAVDAAWDDVADADRGRVLIDREPFAGLPPAVRAYLLRRAVRLAKGGLEDLETRHVEDMLSMMEGRAGRSLDLPGGLALSVGYRTAAIGSAGLDTCPLPPIEGETPLAVPGETMVGGWRVAVQAVSDLPGDGADGMRAAISREAAFGGLTVRSRRAGDRFQPLGMTNRKKLKSFIIDCKIDRSWRDRVPLVVGERGIAWVVGWRIAEWAKPSASGPNLLLAFEGEEN